MTKAQMKNLSQSEIDRAEKDFQNLKLCLEKDMCSYCDRPVTFFAKSQPCFHWLLSPRGFRKRHFHKLYEIKSYHEINTYLRWISNTEVLLRNINDWVEEKAERKVIEETIKYKKLEWSFSCDKSDLAGHASSDVCNFPHYHFQMKVDGNVVINYGSNHIPFTEYDLFVLKVKEGAVPGLSYQHTHGSGMQKMFDTYSPEELLSLMNTKHATEETGKNQFHLQTLVTSKSGNISGEKIAELQKKNQETGIPMAQLLKDVEDDDLSVLTMIEPGGDIPEIPKRTPKKR